MNSLISVQFYSTQGYTYEAPDNFPDDARKGDLLLVPVGDPAAKNYTEKWKVVRLIGPLDSAGEMAAKSLARQKGFDIKKACLWLDPKIVS